MAQIRRASHEFLAPGALAILEPDGCFIRIADGSYLVWGDCLYRWSCEGYTEKRHRPDRADVEILTPEPIVQCLNQGYLPKVHDSLMTL